MLHVTVVSLYHVQVCVKEYNYGNGLVKLWGKRLVKVKGKRVKR